MSDRSAWQSKTGFLLAALGSAIGLGNIWRFPYMAYRNGGGAFLVPYFVALFVVGIPLLMLEFGLGHYFRRAFPQALGKIHSRFRWIGWWSVSFVMFGIVVYYAIVIAWCGNYLVYSVTQPWGESENVASYFDNDFSGHAAIATSWAGDPSKETFTWPVLGKFHWNVFGSLAVIWFINWLITRQELQRGIELANKIFIPLLIGLTTILVIWALTLPGASDGIYVYMTPNWSQAFKPATWIDAFTQIFFTLSVGFGIMVAYASYLPQKTDIPTSAFLAAIGNCLFSVFAGFAVFAAAGFLANEKEIDLRSVPAISKEVSQLEELKANDPGKFAAVQSRYETVKATHTKNEEFQDGMKSIGLLFKTYPAIISEMGPTTGRIFGVMFFFSLVVAGISSSISIVEAFLAALSDEFGWKRGHVSTVLCGLAFLLGIVYCTQSGLFWLDLVDHFVTTYGLVLVGIAEAIIVGWMFTARKLRSHLDEYRDFRLGGSLGVMMRVLITAVLLLTWYGLSQMEDHMVATSVARFLVLGSAVIVWMDEHWLDFDIRLMVPGLLIFLLDRALIQELTSPYGGYLPGAVSNVGLAWFAGTLVIAFVLAALSNRVNDADENGNLDNGNGNGNGNGNDERGGES